MKDLGQMIIAGIVVSLASTVIWREMNTEWWRTKHYYGRIERKLRKLKREV